MSTSITLSTGDIAPDFTLTADDGSTVSLHDYKGKQVIVYFYPAAMTPGCTTQACDFRDNINRLTSMGYEVLGISHDNIESLVQFKQKDNLNFPLLSDEDLAVHKAYDVYGEKMSFGIKTLGVKRSTFVINPDGTIA
ncbi:MAG: thioredoxin-dependent thiol peroxidase, partial [Bifidobacteriaceae bacterium]|nr:thioredoxin-dependent thiol peroxidase [Bifidobacteriaceae bacterium]